MFSSVATLGFPAVWWLFPRAGIPRESGSYQFLKVRAWKVAHDPLLYPVVQVVPQVPRLREGALGGVTFVR